jgi:hypothetical protein
VRLSPTSAILSGSEPDAPRRNHGEVELSISIAPVVLGVGKRLFDDFDQPLRLEHVSLLRSPFATHLTYRVSAAAG